METIGILHHIGQTQTISEKLIKRDFVVKTDASSPYPQFITFQLINDKCQFLDKFNIGDELKVEFNLKGREYNNPTKGLQYFNTLDAWRVNLNVQTPNFGK